MIVHTQHAKMKREQRDIDKEKVEETIRNPNSVEDTYAGRKAAYKDFGNLYLKVVFVKEGQDIIVITQHWTDVVN